MADRPRVLWLHTQPEHYFNLMIDALNEKSDLEYIAGYMHQAAGNYQENAPRHSRHLTLHTKPGKERGPAVGFRSIHVDWKKQVEALNISCGIIAGYAGTTQRAFIHQLHRRGIPLLMASDSNIRTQHASGWRRWKRAIKKRALTSLVRDCDRLLTTNSRGVAYWRYFGAPRDKIVVCPYYADYAAVERGQRTVRSEVLGATGLAPDRKIILTAARLVPAKRIDLMIRAFCDLALADKGWMYVIAGTGPLDQELKALAAAQLGRGIFFTGFAQPEMLLSLMCHADIFALPSDYEPHGIVVGEACAAGTPVLASDAAGAAHDLVFEGISGWRFRSGNAEDCKRKLLAAVSNPTHLTEMRPTTRRIFEQWFVRTNPVEVADREVHRLLGERTDAKGARG